MLICGQPLFFSKNPFYFQGKIHLVFCGQPFYFRWIELWRICGEVDRICVL